MALSTTPTPKIETRLSTSARVGSSQPAPANSSPRQAPVRVSPSQATSATRPTHPMTRLSAEKASECGSWNPTVVGISVRTRERPSACTTSTPEGRGTWS